VIAPSINTGTFGVAPQDAGVASATVTVGQQLGASIGTSLLNTVFASAVTAYLAAHLASARVIGRQALAGLALAHGYDTAFWWTAGIFAAGAVIAGLLFRRGPLVRPAAAPPDEEVKPRTVLKKELNYAERSVVLRPAHLHLHRGGPRGPEVPVISIPTWPPPPTSVALTVAGWARPSRPPRAEIGARVI
jgi:hypothetical protein